MTTFIKNKLTVKVFQTRDEMGLSAAKDIEKTINEILIKKEFINIIFAAAPSQNDVLFHLINSCDIPWNRINAFHMDEYIGLDNDAPQRFSKYLTDHIFSKVNFKSINLISPSNNPDIEIKRYSSLLKEYRPDVVVMGIGENGHIAFNDPPVADFNDKEIIKVVKLDNICRQQQVNDGCFAHFDDVPTHALTLTVPTLFNADYLFCVVPCSTKANAVKETLNGSIDEHCPASILRKHQHATMYLDKDSAKLIC